MLGGLYTVLYSILFATSYLLFQVMLFLSLRLYTNMIM